MKNCKICENKLEKILDLGKMPVANGFIRFLDKEEFKFHLELFLCPHCLMVQLGEIVEPEVLFHEDYPFFSSTSRWMKDHFQKQGEEILEILSDKEKPFVVELGCNDGIMLEFLQKKGIDHAGIEPSGNVARVAKEKGIRVLNSFFNQKLAADIKNEFGSADVISGSNVMCHIRDLHSVFDGFETLLKKEGLIFFEDPYLLDILKKVSFDQIYDEHVYYFSAHSIRFLAEAHGFEIVKIRPLEVHGGSVRFYLRRKGVSSPEGSVEEYLEREKKFGMDKLSTYEEFDLKIKRLCEELNKTLTDIKKEGKNVVGYGATSKSTTLLNYARIGPDVLEYISDITPAKIGKWTPGTHIPIKSYEEFQKSPPAYSLLLAWNHQDEIFNKERDYLSGGGKFIVPFPEVKIIRGTQYSFNTCNLK